MCDLCKATPEGLDLWNGYKAGTVSHKTFWEFHNAVVLAAIVREATERKGKGPTIVFLCPRDGGDEDSETEQDDATLETKHPDLDR